MEKRVRRARIADVAVAAGVSKSTVSFSFNNPERLSPETTARVRAVAEALGYRPHPVARMLAQRRTMNLGILTPQDLTTAFGNPFFSAFSQGVASVAEELGYGLLFVSPLHGSLERAAGRATVDGFVAIGLGENHPEVEQIRQAGLPIVLVDSAAFPDHGSIEVEDTAGAATAAEHLLELGHTEFLILAVEPPRVETEQGAEQDTEPGAGRGAEQGGATTHDGGITARRLRGYRDALAAAGIVLGDERVLEGPASFAGGMTAFNKACDDGLHFTAVMAMSDAMAIGALNAARHRGLRVPEDVSVVGFDDVDVGEQTSPQLTTVHQPIAEKGAEAVRLLMSAIDRHTERPEHRHLETRLVVRGSTGRARQSNGGGVSPSK